MIPCANPDLVPGRLLDAVTSLLAVPGMPFRLGKAMLVGWRAADIGLRPDPGLLPAEVGGRPSMIIF